MQVNLVKSAKRVLSEIETGTSNEELKTFAHVVSLAVKKCATINDDQEFFLHNLLVTHVDRLAIDRNACVYIRASEIATWINSCS